ncbi:hypothetical protein D1095_02360 [Actinobacillus pleuropneumoniae serovar 2 str. S1536]|nr:hypothetical protein D1095_02360 [Actinobacillus pleuropneumoniae serovar 2 str. S1536]
MEPSLPFKVTPVVPSLPLTPIVPSLPSLPSLPAGPPTVKSLFRLKVTLLLSAALVITTLPSVLLKLTLPFGATFVSFCPFAEIFQPALAVFFTSFN